VVTDQQIKARYAMTLLAASAGLYATWWALALRPW
jgi:hypothetical protein